MASKKKKREQVFQLMDLLLEDITVPRNVKRALESAKEELNKEGEIKVRAGAAIYHLREVTEDVNLPFHARAQIWQIMSLLEQLKA